MKLASFRPAGGSIRIGAALGDDAALRLVDLQAAATALGVAVDPFPASMIEFIEGGTAMRDRAERVLDALRSKGDAVPASVFPDPATTAYLPPVPRPGKFISVGANYRSHNTEIPKEVAIEKLRDTPTPAAFSKLPSVLIGHRANIVYPRQTELLDYENELAFIIGPRCKDVARKDALDVIYGYTIFNDVTMRDVQFAEMPRGLLLFGKSFDTSGPMGPWLVTRDEIADPQNLQLTTTVNGESRQNDTTAKMIFPVDEIIAYWSQITLEPGDAFSTGTPSGVALTDRARSLKPGDKLALTIGGLGTLENTVVAG